MKKMKKVLSLLLATSMVCSLSACSSGGGNATDDVSSQSESNVSETTEKDPVTLEWYFRGNGQQQDTDLVEGKVNEILKTYPGLEHVSINIDCYTGDEYQQAVTLAQSANKQIDILNTVSLTSFPKEVENGSFMPLDDLMPDDLKSGLPEWLWDHASVNGQIYMVPNYQ